jgi:hypothetical protein
LFARFLCARVSEFSHSSLARSARAGIFRVHGLLALTANGSTPVVPMLVLLNYLCFKKGALTWLRKQMSL